MTATAARTRSLQLLRNLPRCKLPKLKTDLIRGIQKKILIIKNKKNKTIMAVRQRRSDKPVFGLGQTVQTTYGHYDTPRRQTQL